MYPASFKDDNGDGLGDLRGLISKLPYLKSLGIEAIWLGPHYKSPRVDEGYDISGTVCARDDACPRTTDLASRDLQTIATFMSPSALSTSGEWSVQRLWARITLTRARVHSQELIDSAHAHGLKIMFDLVVNHCSNQHAWFKESRKDKTNPKRDWFYWKPAKYDADGGEFSPEPPKPCCGESVWRISRR